jgi:glutamate/tyrosine decarboxylase-like PLP-dependent enzyme
MQSSVKLEVALNMKCWHWVGPIGDSRIYIDTKKVENAELALVSVCKAIPNWRANESLEEMNEVNLDYENEKPNIADLHKRLINMESQSASIKVAVWIIALAVTAIVVALLNGQILSNS